MIQDIGDHAFDNGYEPCQPEATDYVLSYRRGQVLLSRGTVRHGPPTLSDWGMSSEQLLCRYLFKVDERRFFLAENETAELRAPGSFAFEPVSRLRFLEPRWLGFAAVTGYQLRNWYDANRYCGHCGAELGHVATSRELACPACGLVVYPKISPAVIVGITDGDRIVLTKYAGCASANHALVAGFCEIGERPEDTVRREVAEEVGLRVTNLRYFGSQPWSFTDTMLLGFFCDVEGPTGIHLDHSELRQGVWVSRADIPSDLSDSSSLTNLMITTFARGGEPR